MIQTRTVAAALARRGIATTILAVTTTGDRDQKHAIENLGSTNVFVTELETALRERRADYAVHSCKDLPSELAADMQIAAISAREDPRDAFCSERYPDFDALPAGAIVGTSSPRRRLQLAALRPDLVYENIRGNVDTRLAQTARRPLRRHRARDGRIESPARAGDAYGSVRDRRRRPGGRAGRARGRNARRRRTTSPANCDAAVNDPAAELCVRCERAALRALRAGCSAPIGIHAAVENGVMVVTAAHVLADGTVLSASDRAPDRGTGRCRSPGSRAGRAA